MLRLWPSQRNQTMKVAVVLAWWFSSYEGSLDAWAQECSLFWIAPERYENPQPLGQVLVSWFPSFLVRHVNVTNLNKIKRRVNQQG